MAETLEPDLVASIVATQFPQLQPVSVRWLGDGYDSNAFEVNADWVFRFPKREDVEGQLLIEARVLPVLAGALTLPIPVFCHAGQPSSRFPFHFAGYPMLPGIAAIHVDPRTIPFARVAHEMGRFLSALHAFPAAEAERLGVPRCDSPAVIDEIAVEALESFPALDGVAPTAQLENWSAYLNAGVPQTAISTGALIHGDIAAEHVLMDPGTGALTGVIDWSDIVVGDRALDFAGMFHWGGESFLATVLTAYDREVDPGTIERARFLAACRGVGDVVFGLERARREYVEAGLRALTMAAGERS